MTEIYNRRVKAIAGNATGSIKISLTPGKRHHGVMINMGYAGGTNTIAGAMTNLTEIRVLVGTTVRWRLTGTQLRDWCLLNGTQYDFEGVPNSTLSQIYLPFSPDWYIANVADALAWNPAILGGNITVELDCTIATTVSVVERVSDDLDAPSAGIITLEVVTPVGGGQAFYTGPEFKAKGRLISASFYPDTGATRVIGPVTMYVGKDDAITHETLLIAENKDLIERCGFTPTASGRSVATIYDIVFVRGDALAHSIDLGAWGSVKFKVEALAGAMTGPVPTLLCRLEAK